MVIKREREQPLLVPYNTLFMYLRISTCSEDANFILSHDFVGEEVKRRKEK